MVENPFATQTKEPLFKPSDKLRRLTENIVTQLSKLDSEGRRGAFGRILKILEERGDISPIANVTIGDHFQTEFSLRNELKTRS